MAVKIIKATNTPGRTPEAADTLLRVAAYCRVSTDSQEQETSYEAQVNHYTSFIRSHPDWQLAGIFADEGISGTQARTRPQSGAMMEACERHEVDLIITKSISRFARNTLDYLNYIRKLKALNIPIIFEKESVNTLESSGELMITILASIAQQESASISQNVRMGIQFGFQEGHGRLNYSVFLGYKRGEKPGSYEIVPEEVDVVRRIYREYLEGFSPSMIADGLTSDGICTPAGGETWFPSSVRRILENEKYCGDLLMQKYYMKDFLTHKCVKNEGERPRYYVEDDHDPIVPRAVFCQAQGELKRRAALVQDPGMLRFGKRMALSGRLVCGRCGRILKRYESGEKSDWRCRQRAREKKSEVVSRQPGCGLRIVGERDVQSAVVEAFNRLPGRRDELIRLEERLLTGEIGRIDTCLKTLTNQEMKMEERLDQWAAAGDGAAGSEGEVVFLKGRIAEIREQKNALYAERADHASREMQVRMLLELVDEMCGRGRKVKVKSGACRDWDDFFRRTAYRPPENVIRDGKMVCFENSLIIRYIDKVIVEDNGCKVVFKAGIEV